MSLGRLSLARAEHQAMGWLKNASMRMISKIQTHCLEKSCLANIIGSNDQIKTWFKTQLAAIEKALVIIELQDFQFHASLSFNYSGKEAGRTVNHGNIQQGLEKSGATRTSGRQFA